MVVRSTEAIKPYSSSRFFNVGARNYQEQLDASKRQLEQLERTNEELLSRFKALEDQLKKARITTFEELAHQDREAKTALITLAKKTQPMRLQGLNIGLFGLTSTGKSTMINSLLGEQRAATGYSETTLTVTRYRGHGFTLYDFPGRNDDMSYFSLEYISFFKGLTHCLILIQATVRENSSLMRLLDEIGVTYHLVFNKFDRVPAAEQAQVKAQVRSQIQSLGLRGVNKVYFISSLNPRQFPDWLRMVQDLLA